MAAQNPERHRLIEKSDEHIAKLPHSKELRSLSSDHDVQKLIERVAEEAREAQKRRERWMLRKAGDRVQALAKRVSEFLAAYSGIIEVVKNVAGEKAQVPYTAISILFIVAVNKTGIEEHIESTLNSITLAFPDLAQICDIVDYSRLHPSLERLTENVIAYSSAAAHYYNRRWFSRLWYVIGHPPNAELDTLKEAIDSDAKAIKNSTYRYTVEKLQYLVNAAEEQRQYAEEQRQLAEELRKDAERRRQAEEADILSDAQTLLQVDPSSSTTVDAYHSALLSIQHMSRSKYKLFDRSVLNSTAYDRWKDNEHSSLFLLQGTSQAADCTSLSWLSIAAFELYGEIKEEKADSFMTRHFFMSEDNMREDVEAYLGMAHVIYQIAAGEPKTITEPGRSRCLRTHTHSEEWSNPEPAEPCHLLRDIIDDEAMSRYASVFIFLDRIDRCTCTASGFVDQLVGLIKEHTCHPAVKIFVIMGETQRVTERSIHMRGIKDRVHLVTVDQEFLHPRH